MPRKSKKKLSISKKSKSDKKIKSRKKPNKNIVRKSHNNKNIKSKSGKRIKSRKKPTRNISYKRIKSRKKPSSRKRSSHYKTTSALSDTPEEQKWSVAINDALTALINTGNTGTPLNIDQATANVSQIDSQGNIPKVPLDYENVQANFNRIWYYTLFKFKELQKLLQGGSIEQLTTMLESSKIVAINQLVELKKAHEKAYGPYSPDQIVKLFKVFINDVFARAGLFYQGCIPDVVEFYQMFQYIQSIFNGLDFNWNLQNISLDKLNTIQQLGALIFFKYIFQGFGNYLNYFQIISNFAKHHVFLYLNDNFKSFTSLFGNGFVSAQLEEIFTKLISQIELEIDAFDNTLKTNTCYCCKVIEITDTVAYFITILRSIATNPVTVFDEIVPDLKEQFTAEFGDLTTKTKNFIHRLYNGLYKRQVTHMKVYPSIFRVPIIQFVLDVSNRIKTPVCGNIDCTGEFKISFSADKALETIFKDCLNELKTIGISESANVKISDEEYNLLMRVNARANVKSNYGIHTLATLIDIQNPSNDEPLRLRFIERCNLNANDKIGFHVRSTIDPLGIVQGIYDSSHDIKRNNSRITRELILANGLPEDYDTKISTAQKILADYSLRVLGEQISTSSSEERSSIFSVIAATNNSERTSYILDKDEQNPGLFSLCSIEEYMSRNVATTPADITSRFTSIKNVSFEDAGSPAAGGELRFDRRNGTINKWDNAPANAKTELYRGEISYTQWEKMNELMNSAALLELIIPCDDISTNETEQSKFRIDIYSRRPSIQSDKFTQIYLEFLIYSPVSRQYYAFGDKIIENDKTSGDESDVNDGLSLTIAVDVAEVLYYTFMHDNIVNAEQYYNNYFAGRDEININWDMIKQYDLFNAIKQRNPGILGLNLKYLGDQLYTINAEIFCQLNKIASTKLQYGDLLYSIFDSHSSLAYFVNNTSGDYVTMGSLLSSKVRLVDNLENPNENQHNIDLALATMLIELFKAKPSEEFVNACFSPLPILVGEKVQGIPIFDKYDMTLNSTSKLKATVVIPQQYQNELFETFFNDKASPRFMTELIKCIKRKVSYPVNQYDQSIKETYMNAKKRIISMGKNAPKNMWERFYVAKYPIIIRNIDELLGINTKTNGSYFAQLGLQCSIPSDQNGPAEQGFSGTADAEAAGKDTSLLTPAAVEAINKHLPLAFTLPAYVCISDRELSTELLLDSLEFGTLRTLYSINCIIGTNTDLYNYSQVGLVQDTETEDRGISESFSADALVLINKFAPKCTCPIEVERLRQFLVNSGTSDIGFDYNRSAGDGIYVDNFTESYLENLCKIFQ